MILINQRVGQIFSFNLPHRRSKGGLLPEQHFSIIPLKK